MEEKELQQKLLFYQLLQNQLEELRGHAVLLQTRYTEVESTRIALDDLKRIKDRHELLIPLGSGVYASGTVGKGDLLANIGAGILMKKTAEEAGSLLETRIKGVESVGEALQHEMIAVITRISELGSELEKAVQRGK